MARLLLKGKVPKVDFPNDNAFFDRLIAYAGGTGNRCDVANERHAYVTVDLEQVVAVELDASATARNVIDLRLSVLFKGFTDFVDFGLRSTDYTGGQVRPDEAFQNFVNQGGQQWFVHDLYGYRFAINLAEVTCIAVTRRA